MAVLHATSAVQQMWIAPQQLAWPQCPLRPHKHKHKLEPCSPTPTLANDVQVRLLSNVHTKIIIAKAWSSAAFQSQFGDLWPPTLGMVVEGHLSSTAVRPSMLAGLCKTACQAYTAAPGKCQPAEVGCRAAFPGSYTALCAHLKCLYQQGLQEPLALGTPGTLLQYCTSQQEATATHEQLKGHPTTIQ